MQIFLNPTDITQSKEKSLTSIKKTTNKAERGQTENKDNGGRLIEIFQHKTSLLKKTRKFWRPNKKLSILKNEDKYLDSFV